jgi:hypothetical protein
MQAALKLKTRVLPGRRIEVTAPELPENVEVELIVMLPEGSVSAEDGQPKPQGVWDFIQSLTPVQRTPEEWAQVEREFREERDSWDR